jgi:methyltransferase family protein
MVFKLTTYKLATQNLTKFDRAQRIGLELGPIQFFLYRVFARGWRHFFKDRTLDANDLVNPLFPVPEALGNEHVRNCRMFEDRKSMLMSLEKRRVWAEVGTYEGAFARAIKDLCDPRELHLIDIDFSRVREKRYVEQTEVIKFHKGPSAEVLSSFPDAYFDYIYIDADHDLWAVAGDVEAAKPKLKLDGWLIFNDYIYFSPSDMRPYGTVPVVNALCVEEGWELVAFALQFKMYCDVAIRRARNPL